MLFLGGRTIDKASQPGKQACLSVLGENSLGANQTADDVQAAWTGRRVLSAPHWPTAIPKFRHIR